MYLESSFRLMIMRPDTFNFFFLFFLSFKLIQILYRFKLEAKLVSKDVNFIQYWYEKASSNHISKRRNFAWLLEYYIVFHKIMFLVLLAVQNTTRTQWMVLQIDLCRHSVPITKAFCTRWRPLRFARVLHDRLSSISNSFFSITLFEWTLELDNMTYMESNSSSLIIKSWITYLKDWTSDTILFLISHYR